MKLADWARKQGIAYLTAYRWFRDGKLPVKAYQSDSGTIIVDDEDASTMELPMTSNVGAPNNDIFSIVLRKVVEFSKNNATVEDFAAYILSNFSLKLNSTVESPRYSKNKPRSEDIQRHFQQFIPKGEKPKPNMFVTDPADFDGLVAEDEHKHPTKITSISATNNSEIASIDNSLYNELFEVFNKKQFRSSTSENLDNTIVSRLSTPQNYTKSINDSDCLLSEDGSTDDLNLLLIEEANDLSMKGATGAFTPTKKEIELSKQFSSNEIKEDSIPRRRGRKPSKNLGKK